MLDWENDFSARHGLTSARWQILGAIALSERAPTAPQLAAGFSRDQLHTAHAVLTSLIQHHQPQDTAP
ncbi:MAG TPA: hypothetical protein PLG97_00605 [Alcaligenes sp.]|nr:hypothetical protein [Alcaligenes sp.]HRL25990.1 hypothetical protein [Alcaligenes sp.]